MAQEDLSILQEIDESLQVEKVEKFLQRHGISILIACIGIVIATGVSVFWKNHVRESNMQQTSILLDASELTGSGKYTDAIRKLQGLDNPSHGITTVSQIMQADAYTQAGQMDKAEKIYSDIAADRNADEALRDIAAISASTIESNRASPNATDMSDKLKTIYNDNSQFSPLAGELYAFHLHKTGKNKEAEDILSAISGNPLLPSQDRMQAKALLDSIREQK